MKNMNKTKINFSTYTTTVAKSLVYYAAKDPNFAEFLKEKAKQIKNKALILDNLEIESFKDTEVISPTDTDMACQKANWLIENINKNKFADLTGAATVFKTWADKIPNDDNQPKLIVVGIKIGVIPGLTFGRFKKKKKLINVVIREDVAKSSGVNLAHDTAKVSVDLFSSALKSAGGNVYRLEPEFGDWFFRGRKLSLYTADVYEMKKILNELKDMNILDAKIKDDKGVSVLALSPAINENYMQTAWCLKRLGE
jgi:peptidyl-tRNA hydrolase